MNKINCVVFLILVSCGTTQSHGTKTVPVDSLSLSHNGALLTANESCIAKPIITYTLDKSSDSARVLIQERTSTPIKSWPHSYVVSYSSPCTNMHYHPLYHDHFSHNGTIKCPHHFHGFNAYEIHFEHSSMLVSADIVLYQDSVKKLNLTATEAFDFAVINQRADILNEALTKLAQQGTPFDLDKVLPFVFNHSITIQTVRTTLHELAARGITLNITSSLKIIHERLKENNQRRRAPLIIGAGSIATVSSVYALARHARHLSQGSRQLAVIGALVGVAFTGISIYTYLQKPEETELIKLLLTSPACRWSISKQEQRQILGFLSRTDKNQLQKYIK